MILAALFFAPSWWPLILPIHFSIQYLVIYPTVRPNCDWFGVVAKRFRTDKKEIWLTIDDGPDPATTPLILDLLKKFGARATFFVVGDRVRAHPQLARAIVDAGHTLGNHTATHPSAWFWAFSKRAAAPEIDDASAAIREATGNATAWFRAPVGLANVFVHRLIAARGMRTIGWSARGFDTVEKDVARIVATVFRDVRPGTIILLHEHDGRVGTRLTSVAVVEAVLDQLQRDGYRCVMPVEAQLPSPEWATAFSGGPSNPARLLTVK